MNRKKKKNNTWYIFNINREQLEKVTHLFKVFLMIWISKNYLDTLKNYGINEMLQLSAYFSDIIIDTQQKLNIETITMQVESS